MKGIDRNTASLLESQMVSLLEKLGFQLLSRKETIRLRDGKMHAVLLEEILLDQLKKINSFEFRERQYQFSENNIRAALFSLENIPEEGVLPPAKRISDLLLLGKSFEETIGGEKKSFSLRFIDWDTITNNVFHLATEFQVSDGVRVIEPDMVLFINGIPVVVVEQKGFSINSAILQQIRQQAVDGPRLYRYAQLLLAASDKEVRYATPGTSEYAWNVWRDEDRDENEFGALMKSEGRIPTSLDYSLYALCRPRRLMDLLSGYLLSGRDSRFVARHYQYFAVQEILKNLQATDRSRRKGMGVIWHAQGTGKTMTMAFAVRNIPLQKENHSLRMLVLTDRVAKQDQIQYAFRQYGIPIFNPDTGRELIRALEDKSIPVILTVVQKLSQLRDVEEYRKDSAGWVILTDEDKAWSGAFYHELHAMFPEAKFFSFISNPLFKDGKYFLTPDEPLLHSYSLEHAVDDNILLPIYYMRAHTVMDSLFEGSNGLKSVNSQGAVSLVANHVIEHFTKNLKGTGLKAMLIAHSQQTALAFQQYFDERRLTGRSVNAATVISVDREKSYGWDSPVDPGVLQRFNEPDDQVELLITVDKLLTGFDSPRIAALYLTRQLRGTNLIQAISRVNRPMAGKENGILVDYVNTLHDIEELFKEYPQRPLLVDELVKIPVVAPVTDQIRDIKTYYNELEQLFSRVKKKTSESLLSVLSASQDLRDLFSEKLSAFDKGMRTALSSESTISVYSPFEMEIFKEKLFFYKSIEAALHALPEAEKDPPAALKNDIAGVLFYWTLREIVHKHTMLPSDENIIQCVLDILAIVRKMLIRDWKRNGFLQKQMDNKAEDILLAFDKRFGVGLSFPEIDVLLGTLMGALEGVS